MTTTNELNNEGIAVLQDVRRLLEDPDVWMKYRQACDRNGSDRDPYDEDAACFCLTGAVYRVTPPDRSGRVPRHMAFHLLRQAMPQTAPADPASPPAGQDDGSNAEEIVAWHNDSPEMSHERILDWIDRSIADAEALTDE